MVMEVEGSWPESTCEAETPKLSSVTAPFLLYIVLLLTCKVLYSYSLFAAIHAFVCTYIHCATVHGILTWCVNIHVCKFQFHGRLTVVQGFSVIHTYICSLASCVRMWQWYTFKKVSN